MSTVSGASPYRHEWFHGRVVTEGISKGYDKIILRKLRNVRGFGWYLPVIAAGVAWIVYPALDDEFKAEVNPGHTKLPGFFEEKTAKAIKFTVEDMTKANAAVAAVATPTH